MLIPCLQLTSKIKKCSKNKLINGTSMFLLKHLIQLTIKKKKRIENKIKKSFLTHRPLQLIFVAEGGLTHSSY